VPLASALSMMLIGFAGIRFADFEYRWARHRIRGVTMKTKLLGLIVGMALLSASQASASTITYNVDIVDAGSGDTVLGTITTDGTFGALLASNFVTWNLTISNNTYGSASLVGPGPGDNSTLSVDVGAPFLATATTLSYNFADNDPTDPGFQFGAGSSEFAVGDAYRYPPDGLIAIGVNGQPSPGDAPTTDVIGTATPLPAALPLFATGLGALGLVGWRRKKKAAALAA
jgi:hypothetical protein